MNKAQVRDLGRRSELDAHHARAFWAWVFRPPFQFETVAAAADQLFAGTEHETKYRPGGEVYDWSKQVVDRLIVLFRKWRAQDRQRYRGIRRSRYLLTGGVKR